MDEIKNFCPPALVCRKKVFDFQERSYVMGILNVTPDSFSDGGKYFDKDRAVDQGVELAEQGADVIDVGGESTRPGSEPVSLDEELKRVIPVIRELASRIDVPLSVDTTKAKVAKAALDAGAEIVNDVSAMRFDPAMAGVVSDYKVPVILMHMLAPPRTMQNNIQYDSLIEDICSFLMLRIRAALDQGIEQDRIIVDPGIGFGKSVEKDNFTILNRLEAFALLGKPVIVGPSRKAFIGNLLGKDTARREAGTAAAVAIAVYKGANFVRVHSVRQIRMITQFADAVKRAG
jgi:dihydropteroate synthase